MTQNVKPCFLGIEDRVGSLEAGRDADLVILDGSPFSVESTVKAVYIDGICIGTPVLGS